MFLEPGDGGVDAALLAAALQGAPRALQERIAHALPASAAATYTELLEAAQFSDEAVRTATATLMDHLFWPLVYWNEPDEFESLIAGERIEPALVDTLQLDGQVVCDIGAGSGRFALLAARRAQRVIAVDATPALLDRLLAHARDAALANIECRRGAFTALPVDDRSVDCAVACSAFRSVAPHGGVRALREAERIVRPGGRVVVIWPQQPDWLEQQGFARVSVPCTDDSVHFGDVETARRLCDRYYGSAAAQWVQEHDSPDVPFTVLGMLPPTELCWKRVG